MHDEHSLRARSFGAVAEQYERHRPGYPGAAIDWLLPPGARTVVDVGAGTGKLTGGLVVRGLRVVAVEPDPEMLAVLRRERPAAQAHQAGADALPLPDGSVDAVLAAQSWHWFPHEDAVTEVRRVLRPGGWLGLIWNQEYPVEPWQVRIAELNGHTGAGLRTGEGTPPAVVDVSGLPGDELESAGFRWTDWLGPAALCDRMATYSRISRMPARERSRLLRQVQALVHAEAERRGTEQVPLSMAAMCVRWRPRGAVDRTATDANGPGEAGARGPAV